jgi:hypothetical protein
VVALLCVLVDERIAQLMPDWQKRKAELDALAEQLLSR